MLIVFLAMVYECSKVELFCISRYYVCTWRDL